MTNVMNVKLVNKDPLQWKCTSLRVLCIIKTCRSEFATSDFLCHFLLDYIYFLMLAPTNKGEFPVKRCMRNWPSGEKIVVLVSYLRDWKEINKALTPFVSSQINWTSFILVLVAGQEISLGTLNPKISNANVENKQLDNARTSLFQ